MQNYFDNEATASALHATMKAARGGKCLVTLSTYEDRKEALLNTTIMEDAGTYRSKAQKSNTSQQIRQQNDTLDNRESKQDLPSQIPKPPPLQMTINSNSYKNNNNKQTTSTANSGNKTFTLTDPMSDQRLSNGTQNSNTNVYNGNNSDTYSRPNKTTTTSNDFNANRQTLRLGTVTIGEYRQQTLRREPEKFDFISSQKKGRDSGDTTPTNEALQNELQNTLSRANLRKSNGSSSHTEHQRNCPLHQQQQQHQLQQRQSLDYGSNGYTMEEMSKKLQKSSLNENNATDSLAKTNSRTINNATGTSGVGGILKNGNRNGTTSSSSSKSIEKSIKFG